jgi:hypothetical protein
MYEEVLPSPAGCRNRFFHSSRENCAPKSSQSQRAISSSGVFFALSAPLLLGVRHGANINRTFAESRPMGRGTLLSRLKSRANYASRRASPRYRVCSLSLAESSCAFALRTCYFLNGSTTTGDNFGECIGAGGLATGFPGTVGAMLQPLFGPPPPVVGPF